ncbi:MAG: LamG-like jellyroll fold domain-containing protein [Candidatus Neomarinimicrobiota bacterium]
MIRTINQSRILKNVVLFLGFYSFLFSQDWDYSGNFDGNDDYVVINHDPVFNISESNGNQGTIMAWVNLNYPHIQEDDWPRIISKKMWWDDSTGYELEVNPYQNIITLVAGGDNYARGVLGPHNNGWVHIAATFNDTSANIYFNGNNVTTDNGINPIVGNEVDLWIGGFPGMNDSTQCCLMNGLMDDIAIFDISLSDSLVQHYATTMYLGSKPNCVANYNFSLFVPSDTTNSILRDQSPNSNHGAIYGSSLDEDVPSYNILIDSSSPELINFTISDTLVDVNSGQDSLSFSASFSDVGYGLSTFKIIFESTHKELGSNWEFNFNGQSSIEWQEMVLFEEDWSEDVYTIIGIHITDQIGNISEFDQNSLNELGFNTSFHLSSNYVNPDSINYSLSFDGNGDYVLIPHNDSLNLDTHNGSQGTVMAWIQPNFNNADAYNWPRILSKKTAWDAATGYDFGYNAFDSTIFFIGSDSKEAKGKMESQYYHHEDWNHVAATFNQDIVKIYLNGHDVTTHQEIDPVQGNQNDLWIGAFSNWADSTNFCWMDGNIDEVAIFNTELSVQEIIWSMLELKTSSQGDHPGPLVGFWDFNEGNGTIVFDASSIGSHGTIGGGTLWDNDHSHYQFIPHWNKPSSIEFDGGDWDDDYVSFGDILDMDDNSFSYSLWVKFDTLNVDWQQMIVSKGADGGTTPSDNGFKLFIPTNSNQIQGHISSSPTVDSDVYSDSVETGIWYFVSIIIDRNANYQKLYLNGVIQDSSSISHIAQINNNCHLHLGNNYWANTGQNAAVMDGKIYGFSFWDQALDQVIINELVNRSIYLGSEGSEDQLNYFQNVYGARPLGLWNFQDSSNTILYSLLDESSESQDGSIINAEWTDDIPVGYCSPGYELIPESIQCANQNQVQVLYDFIDLSDSLSLETIGNNIFNFGYQEWEDGNLVRLNIDGYDINSFPNSISVLSHLKVLNLQNNQIQQLPSSIGDLTNLLELDLSGNQLSTIPIEIGNIDSLIGLYLNYNQFSEIPQSILQLDDLENLFLSDNQIIYLPSNIGDLSKLKLFDLTRNQISEIPSALGNLINLTAISFWDNNISALPSSLSTLVNLNYLDIEGNQFYEWPNVIENYNQLGLLWIGNNHLFCNDGEVNMELIPQSLIDFENLHPDLDISGLDWQDCDYQLLQPINEYQITGSSGFRFLSSPVSGKIYADLLDELWTQGAEGSDLPESNPNIWTYNNGWNVVDDLNDQILDPGKGILVYVFADTDYDGDDDLPVTISVNEDSAAQKFNNNWNNFTLGSQVSSSEWNLLGNPYGLAIDVQSLLNQNSSYYSTIYMWDNENLTYKTHNGISGDIFQGLVAPFEGFWIQTLNLDSSEFIFDYENMTVNSYGNSGRNSTSSPDSTGYGVLTFESGGYSSSIYVSFSESGDVNLDPADARRIVPMQPSTHLTSMIYESGKSLSINNLPLALNNDFSYPLDVMMLEATETGYETQEAQVSISYDLFQLPEGITLALKDNLTGEMIYLEGSSSEISLPSKGSFNYPTEHMSNYPEVGASQLTLLVYSTLASVEAEIIPETYALSQAYPNPFNPSTVIGYDLPMDSYVKMDVYDIRGRHVSSLVDGMVRAGKQEFTWTTNQLASGIYLVKLVTGGQTFNQKITYLK